MHLRAAPAFLLQLRAASIDFHDATGPHAEHLNALGPRQRVQLIWREAMGSFWIMRIKPLQ